MTLVPDPNEPGLWTNPAWEPGTPGTFMITIGVSAYDHLPGGKGAVRPETYGLGQLAVSALTAHEFFTWAQTGYDYTPPGDSPCPLAHCWLLLSHTADEKAFRPDIDQNLLTPTFRDCDDAIKKWHYAMANLPKEAAEASRLFFFFSGHGLEITQEDQVLLPSDYLAPITGDFNDAINLAKLAKACAGLSVSEQFFFSDACRNDHEELRSLMIEGDGIITATQAFLTNPGCNGPILYASASGTQTFQPASPQKDDWLSIFGQAVLDGLYARKGYEQNCGDFPCGVKFALLHEFLNARVNELLREHHMTLTQHVLHSGRCSRPMSVLTYAPEMTLQPVTPPKPPLAETLSEEFTLNYKSLRWKPTANKPLRVSQSAHEILGRETVTHMWQTARVFSVEKGKWLDPDKSFRLDSVSRTEGNSEYRITLSLPGRYGTHWLELSDGSKTFGCILPGDHYHDPIYTLEFTVEDLDQPPKAGGHRHPVTRFTASLSLDNTGILGDVAKLWEKYETASPLHAAEEMDMQLLNDALRRKMSSPLSAIVAALILLRAGRTDLLPLDWMKNLSNSFDQYADGPVLLNEHRLRNAGEWRREDQIVVLDSLKESLRRGWPCCTGEAFGYAVRQGKELVNYSSLSSQEKKQAREFDTQLAAACQFFRTGGLFTVFAGNHEALYGKFLGHLIPT